MEKVLYSAVVLDKGSQLKLIRSLEGYIPSNWKIFAHHMTIVFGQGLPENIKDMEGEKVNLKVSEVGMSDMAMAVKVSGFYSKNDIPHVTVAVNVDEGGKPFMSNKITNWKPLSEFNITSDLILSGIVTEIKK